MISNLIKPHLALVILAVSMAASWAFAAVEINLEKTLSTDGVPLDVAVSRDGSRTFVLTDKGTIIIYDQAGNQADIIKIGSHINQIELDPNGERLFATSRQNKSVEIIAVDFIHQINTLGSPLKGLQEAPVTIAVFSDFQ